jgi:hypothetical protein
VRFESTINEARADWRSAVGNVDHLDAIEALSATIREELNPRNGASEQMVTQRRWSFAVARFGEIVSQLRSQIHGAIDNPRLEVFTLAEWFDRLTNPVPAYDCMTLDRDLCAPVQNPGWDAQPTPREPQCTWIPRLPLLRYSDWPSRGETEEQVRARLRHLRMDKDALTLLLDTKLSSKAGRGQLEQAILSKLGLPAPTEKGESQADMQEVLKNENNPKYLGLVLDTERSVLWTIDGKRFREVRGQTECLIDCFMRARGSWTTADQLREKWKLKSGRRVRKAPIDSALTHVKETLRFLCHDLENNKLQSWRIIEKPFDTP